MGGGLAVEESRVNRLLNNMTVRLSWNLVLGLFAVLVCSLSALGLYSLGFAEQTIAALQQAGQPEAFAGFASVMRWVIVMILLVSAVSIVAVVWGVNRNVILCIGSSRTASRSPPATSTSRSRTATPTRSVSYSPPWAISSSAWLPPWAPCARAVS